jgi:DNA repair exonuclease SbcCD ATPase subunit
MLSEIAAQQAKDAEPTQEATPTVRLVENDSDKATELESTKRDLAAAQVAADGYAKRYHDLEKTAEQSSAALTEANAAKDKLEGELAILKAELDTTRDTPEEPTAASTSAFDGERSALKSRIEELKIQLSAANASLEAQTRDHDEHKISLAKELETAHASKAASASDVEQLTLSLGELQKSHDNVSTEHESTKSSLAAQLALVAAHEASLKQKDNDWNDLTQKHEYALAESTSQLDAASSKLQALTTEHEALQLKHTEAISALESARSEASAAGETLSGEHQAALAALTKDLDASKAQLEESNALAESLKKEHAEAYAALNAELEAQRSSLDKVASDAKGHEDRALSLDEELQSTRTAHKSSEDAHLATKAELDSLIADKTGLEAKIAAFTTASSWHEAQVAELEKVNKELAELKLELEGHATTKSDLEAKIATLEGDAEGHATTRSDLETSQAKITELERLAEGHATSRAELEAKIVSLEDDIGKYGTNNTELQTRIAELESSAAGHGTAKTELESKIAALQADAETHATTVSELELSQARATELEGQVEKHEATRAELDTAQAHIAELKTVSEAHEVQKTELVDAKTQIESLSKDIEAHEIVKKDLTTAQTQIADLEKSLESGKADHATISEKLSSVEASLLTTTADHEKLTASLLGKESALQEALKDLETQKSQLSEKAAALTEAQEALEKAKAEASQASELSKDLKAAQEKVNALEQELVSSNEKHEAETASLSSKVKDIWKLREQNDLLQQQLAAAQESERTAKSSVTKLEADLRSAKDVQPISAHEDSQKDHESSGLGKAALAVGALGAVGAGAFGVSKLLDDDDDDDDKENKSISKEQSESVAVPPTVPDASPDEEPIGKNLDLEKPDSTEAKDEQSNDEKPIEEELSQVKPIHEELNEPQPVADEAVDIEAAHQDLAKLDVVQQESTEQDSTAGPAVLEHSAEEQSTEGTSVEKESLSEDPSAQHVIPVDAVSKEPAAAPKVAGTSSIETPANSDVPPENPEAEAIADEDEPAPINGLTEEPSAKGLDVNIEEKTPSADVPADTSADLSAAAIEEADAKTLSVDTEAPSVEVGKISEEAAPAELPSAIGFTPIEPYPESAIEAPASKLAPVEEASAEEKDDQENKSPELVPAKLQEEPLKEEVIASESKPLETSSNPEDVQSEQTAGEETSKADLVDDETQTGATEADEPPHKVGDSAYDDPVPLDEVSKPVDALPEVGTQRKLNSDSDDANALTAVASSLDEQEVEILADKPDPIEAQSIEPASIELVEAITESKTSAIAADSQHDEELSATDGPDRTLSKEISEPVAELAPIPPANDQAGGDSVSDAALAEPESVETLSQASTNAKEVKDEAIVDTDAAQVDTPAQVKEPKDASDELDELHSETSPHQESAGEEEEASNQQRDSETVFEPANSIDVEETAQIEDAATELEIAKDIGAVTGSPLIVANSEEPESILSSSAKSEDSQAEASPSSDDEVAAASEEVSTPEKAVESENVATSEPIDEAEPAKEPIQVSSLGHEDDSDELRDHIPADETPASLHDDNIPAEAADSGTKTDVDASTILVPLPGGTAATPADGLPKDHELAPSAIASIPPSDLSEHSVEKHDVEAESTPSASEPVDKVLGPGLTDDGVKTPDTIGAETPKIKCLTCGDDIDMDGLAEHFCAPTASPAEIAETAGPQADARVDEPVTNVLTDRNVDHDSAIKVLTGQPSSASADQEHCATSFSPIEEQHGDGNAVPSAVSYINAVKDSVDNASTAEAAEDTAEPLANGVSDEAVLPSVESVVDASTAPVPSLVVDKDAEEVDGAVQDEHLPTAGESAAFSTEVASTDATRDVDDFIEVDALKTSALPVEDSAAGKNTNLEQVEDTDASPKVLTKSSDLVEGGDDTTLKVDHLSTDDHLLHTDDKSASDGVLEAEGLPKEVLDVATGTSETPEHKSGAEDLTKAQNAAETKSDQKLELDELKSTPMSQSDPEATGENDGQELEAKGEQISTTPYDELEASATQASQKLVPTSVVDDRETSTTTATIEPVEPVTKDPTTLDQAANGNATPDDSTIQQSPSTPQTPSKRKSVRWEDIETSKQSTPVEELEKQLDGPLVNGAHADTTAEKHSVGPGSPPDELQGLAISDVPLSQEPATILEDDRTSVSTTPLAEQSNSAEEKVTSNETESTSKGPEDADSAEDDLDTSVDHASAEAYTPQPKDTTGQSDIESGIPTSTTEEPDQEHINKAAETKDDASKGNPKVCKDLETPVIDFTSSKEPESSQIDVDSEPLNPDYGADTTPLLSETETQVNEDGVPSLDNQKILVGSESPNLDWSHEGKEAPVASSAKSANDDDDATLHKAPITPGDDVKALSVEESIESSPRDDAEEPAAHAIVDKKEQISELDHQDDPNAEGKSKVVADTEADNEDPELPARSAAQVDIGAEEPSVIDEKDALSVDDDDGQVELNDSTPAADAKTASNNPVIRLEKEEDVKDDTVASTIDDEAEGASKAERKNVEVSAAVKDAGKEEVVGKAGEDRIEGEDDNEAAPGLGQKLAAKTSDLVSVVKDKLTPSKDEETEK